MIQWLLACAERWRTTNANGRWKDSDGSLSAKPLDQPSFARNASTSERDGIEACAPRRVTEMAAAAEANRAASHGSFPSSSAAPSADRVDGLDREGSNPFVAPARHGNIRPFAAALEHHALQPFRK